MRSPVKVSINSATRLLPTLKVVFIAIVVFTTCFLPGALSAKESDKEVYTGEVPVAADDGQRISIVIEKSDEAEAKGELPESRANNGIFAEGDGEGGEDSENDRPPSETTTWDKCRNGGDCCYQYTWQGYKEQIPAIQNSTCEYLWAEKRDESVACFDPIVFTIPTSETRYNTPPNFTQLRDQAQSNNWNIYCPKPGKNCVTYTYYSSDSKQITNQTKFCGIVTDLNTGDRISNGCHKQKASGFIREVCVCDGSLCNGAGSIAQLFTYLPLVIALTTGTILRLVIN